MLPLAALHRLEERRPSIVYEEDIPVNVRRGSVTMTVRITSEEDASDQDSKDLLVKTPSGDEELSLLGCGNWEDGSDTRRSSKESIESGRFESSPSPTPTLIVSSSNNSSRNTLKVPGSLHSSSSSLEDDPKFLLRRRSLPKARSTDCVEPLGGCFLQPRRYSAVSSSYFLENFIKGRRSSTGAFPSQSGVIHTRRRLSDQVGRKKANFRHK